MLLTVLFPVLALIALQVLLVVKAADALSHTAGTNHSEGEVVLGHSGGRYAGIA